MQNLEIEQRFSGDTCTAEKNTNPNLDEKTNQNHKNIRGFNMYTKGRKQLSQRTVTERTTLKPDQKRLIIKQKNKNPACFPHRQKQSAPPLHEKHFLSKRKVFTLYF